MATRNPAPCGDSFLQRSEYDPHGFLANRPMQDGPGYTGHITDAATGLVYMQQRYYDPLIPRFLSVDPVTAYDNPIGAFHRYRYANNNPYKFTDPDGREASECNPPESCVPRNVKERIIEDITGNDSPSESTSVTEALRGEAVETYTDKEKWETAAKGAASEVYDSAKEVASSTLSFGKSVAVCAPKCALQEFIGDTALEMATTVVEEGGGRAAVRVLEDGGHPTKAKILGGVLKGAGIVDGAQSLVCAIQCVQDRND